MRRLDTRIIVALAVTPRNATRVRSGFVRMSNDQVPRTHPRRRSDGRQPVAAPPTPAKRDTVTLQWIAVGVAAIGLIVAAAYFTGGQTGGGGHGAPAVAQHPV